MNIQIKQMLHNNSSRLVILSILLSLTCLVQAYRIEVSVKTLPNTPLFLAGYYGERIMVVDSIRLDSHGNGVFEKSEQLCSGIYTLVAPGKMMYDFLLDDEQQLSIDLGTGTNQAKIARSRQTETYAAYLVWQEQQTDKKQLPEHRRQLISRHPNTFLAAYLTALQPINAEAKASDDGMEQIMTAYHYRRRHFFDNFNLSDVRLLHTPLYHEKIQFYISKFVTQQADSLIHNAYRMLELASGNHETFFYMSDFLIDFSLRSKVENISKLHNFLQRNRYMYGEKAIALLPVKSRSMQFMVKDEQLLQNQLEAMELMDTDRQVFDAESIGTRFRIFYFWTPDCPRCLADVPKWQAVLNKRQSKSCFGIAVNTATDVQRPENRILTYEPLCVNVSMHQFPKCAQVFYTSTYAKIIVTNTAGSIIGIFGSSASLDEFLGKVQ